MDFVFGLAFRGIITLRSPPNLSKCEISLSFGNPLRGFLQRAPTIMSFLPIITSLSTLYFGSMKFVFLPLITMGVRYVITSKPSDWLATSLSHDLVMYLLDFKEPYVPSNWDGDGIDSTSIASNSFVICEWFWGTSISFSMMVFC